MVTPVLKMGSPERLTNIGKVAAAGFRTPVLSDARPPHPVWLWPVETEVCHCAC